MEMIQKQCFICKEIIQGENPAKIQLQVADENGEPYTIHKYVCGECEKFMEYMTEKIAEIEKKHDDKSI